MIEKFQIPAVAGIIERNELGVNKILVQERVKSDALQETGLIEIPSGKIQEFENIFNALRREVFEETGLRVTYIAGEDSLDTIRQNSYEVIGFEPFFIGQNLAGTYPIMVTTFLCQAEGKLLDKTDESENIRWLSVVELREMLINQQDRFYPMHISALMKYTKLKLGIEKQFHTQETKV